MRCLLSLRSAWDIARVMDAHESDIPAHFFVAMVRAE